MRYKFPPQSFARAARLLLLIATAFSLSMLGACQDLMNIDPPKEEEPVDKNSFIDLQTKRYVDTPDTSKHLVEHDDAASNPEKIVEQANALSREKLTANPDPLPVKATAHPFYEDFILLNADEVVEVAMTFNATPLVDVLPAFADILGFNFTVNGDIKNTITLNINSNMTRRELWELFDATLRLVNVSALKTGNSLRIMLSTQVPSQSDLRTGNRGNGSSEVMTFMLRYMTPRELSAQLKVFLTRAGAMIEMTRQNILLVSDTSDNMLKIKQIVEAADQPGRQNWPRSVIYCQHVKASRIEQDLSDILPSLGLPVKLSTDRTENPGSIYLSSIDRIQVIVVSAATEEAIQEIKQWVAILDNSDPVDQERVYVYKIAHGKASQMIQAISAIFSTQGASLTIDTNTGNQRTEQVTTSLTRNNNTQVANTDRYSTNNMLNIQVDRASSVFDNPIRVFADGVQNRLVIRATPRAYAVIKAMLDRIDVVPAQVLLQVMIAEVKLTDGNEFGIEFNDYNTGGSVGSEVGTHYEDIAKGSEDAEGMKLGIFNPNNPDETFAFLRALASRNKVKIVSSPQLLVTSNTEAKITVGEDVPLLQSDYTDVDSQGSTSRSYVYRETGVILTITPQVTSTDLISLELEQEISEAVVNTITTAKDTPVITQRILQTSMSIANGYTMVIGGIIQERVKDNLKSVPIISDIPFLGRLLGNTVQSSERTELLVMITGYIVNEKSPVKDMVHRYNDAVKALSLFESNIEKQNKADAEAMVKTSLKPVTENTVRNGQPAGRSAASKSTAVDTTADAGIPIPAETPVSPLPAPVSPNPAPTAAPKPAAAAPETDKPAAGTE